MNDENRISDLSNPHDKLFRETWSNLENARSFFQHSLPGHVLGLMDLSTLEISKDSFVEKELTDYCDSVVDLPWETIMAEGYDPVVSSFVRPCERTRRLYTGFWL